MSAAIFMLCVLLLSEGINRINISYQFSDEQNTVLKISEHRGPVKISMPKRHHRKTDRAG